MARPHRITILEAQAKRWTAHYAEPERWFWSRVDRSGGEDACWPWTGRVDKGRRGYGRLYFKHRHIGAHRMALGIATGGMREGMFACHRCDNPVCCNPKHLFWGTAQDNVDDCIAKGRKRSRQKIDLDLVTKRRAEGLSYAELAAEFGANQASIGKALQRASLRAQSAMEKQP